MSPEADKDQPLKDLLLCRRAGCRGRGRAEWVGRFALRKARESKSVGHGVSCSSQAVRAVGGTAGAPPAHGAVRRLNEGVAPISAVGI